jgi:AraC family L-rhamnose operon regulatory protein RhaS
MAEPVIFQDKEKAYFADTCEPLKAAAERNEVYLRGWARGNYPGLALPPHMLPQLRSLGVWDAARPQSWGLDLHCNEGLEFTYLARGKTAFEVDGKKWLLHKGDLTITRPWQFHRVGNPNVGASRLIWLIMDVDVRSPNQPWQWPDWLQFAPGDLNRLTDLLRHNEQPVWQTDSEIASCFARLDALLEEQQPAERQSRLTLTINELLIALLEMLDRKQIPLDDHLSTTQRTVELFLAELHKHLEEPWTLRSMAHECGLARSQFATYCKQVTNLTPVEYLNTCRIERAAQLLAESPMMTVTEVAYACGFNSSQYFASAFRTYRGCTPTEFRLRRGLSASPHRSSARTSTT